jgi:hypothetical protein
MLIWRRCPGKERLTVWFLVLNSKVLSKYTIMRDPFLEHQANEGRLAVEHRLASAIAYCYISTISALLEKATISRVVLI